VQVTLLLLLSVLAPSVDVYTDTAAVLLVASLGEPAAALCLLLPQVLRPLALAPAQAANTCLTLALWRRLEPEGTRSWSWVLVLLQCWPQVQSTVLH
jgi:hypothetical protein